MPPETLAIDFGTSNSAVAVMAAEGVRRIPIDAGAETLPTAVFFPHGNGQMLIGQPATDALIDGAPGRYMRALKSVLGLPLLQEARPIGGRSRTIAEVITDFLGAVRDRAEAETGARFRQALSGRPVHFHTNDNAKDAQAEADLRACYLAAGFEEVTFLAEPEAAAIASLTDAVDWHGAGLVVDIGGGTSDFTAFRRQGDWPEILGSHGIRLGGTDFDRTISLTHTMPLLGLGGMLRRHMGDGLLPVPRAPFVDLATWAKIPFLYAPDGRRAAADMARRAVDRRALGRFADVLELELGHALAFAVEHGKITANERQGGGQIDMGFIEAGLTAEVTGESLGAAMADSRKTLALAAAETLNLAGLKPEDVDRVVLVGGSSLMTFVTEEMQALCPGAEIVRSAAFTAVVDGLARATTR